jgi:lysophospholipase L1-like esterase
MPADGYAGPAYRNARTGYRHPGATHRDAAAYRHVHATHRYPGPTYGDGTSLRHTRAAHHAGAPNGRAQRDARAEPSTQRHTRAEPGAYRCADRTAGRYVHPAAHAGSGHDVPAFAHARALDDSAPQPGTPFRHATSDGAAGRASAADAHTPAFTHTLALAHTGRANGPRGLRSFAYPHPSPGLRSGSRGRGIPAADRTLGSHPRRDRAGRDRARGAGVAAPVCFVNSGWFDKEKTCTIIPEDTTWTENRLPPRRWSPPSATQGCGSLAYEVKMRIAFVGDSLTAGIPGSSYLALLQQALPGHTLVNLGWPNDTVISLHRRITRHRFAEPLDLVFLWVGINDVGKHASWFHAAYSILRRRRRARHLDEFRACYQHTLECLLRVTGRVVAVAPLCKGEDLGSVLNCQVALYARAVEKLAQDDERIEFLDLRPAFAARLAGRPISGYLPHSPVGTIWDALTLRTDVQVDRRSRQRGLHLTLDGLHLNSAGAELVAAVFGEAIEKIGATPADAAPAPGPQPGYGSAPPAYHRCG